MSAAIIKFEDTPDLMYYCKYDSYPAGIGFDLLNIAETTQQFITFLCDNSDRFQLALTMPKDIQYEYIINKDNTIHCQECWYAADVAYHGGGFRRGGTYDLKEWREKIRLEKSYSYRLPEYWN